MAKCGLSLEVKKSHYSLYIFSILKLKFHDSSSPSIVNAKVCCAVFNSENQVVATAFFLFLYVFRTFRLSSFLCPLSRICNNLTFLFLKKDVSLMSSAFFPITVIWYLICRYWIHIFIFLLQVHNIVCRVFLLNANHEFAIIFQSKDWHCGKLYLYGFNMPQ